MEHFEKSVFNENFEQILIQFSFASLCLLGASINGNFEILIISVSIHISPSLNQGQESIFMVSPNDEDEQKIGERHDGKIRFLHFYRQIIYPDQEFQGFSRFGPREPSVLKNCTFERCVCSSFKGGGPF